MHIQGLINFPIYEKGILSHTHIILHDNDTQTSEHVAGSECYQVEEGQRRPSLVGHSSWQGHKEELGVLLIAKDKFIKERTERTPQGRSGPNQERHWHKNVRCGGGAVGGWGGCFKDRTFTFSLRGHVLTVLIDIYKLHNDRLYGACLSHNSVHCNQTYVCIEYL